ncbi:MAG: 50S ribosomal protein L4 [Clostridiales bacterium]|nr:50S ribosomal protein L4 [Clostridiales bacterium]
MPTTKVFNMAGQVIGEVELSEAVFGVTPNAQVIHESVKNHLANVRQGTQSALTRAEVAGGGAKPYRQKGTGRARQGSIRAVQFTHGGVAFAPKPRDYSYTINKKMKKLALKSALSQKVIDDAVVVVENLDMENIKTQDFAKFLTAIGVTGKALVVTPEVRETIVKSARNLPGVQTTFAAVLNVYDVMKAKTFVVDKAALQTIEEVYA